ncbi:MAG: hydrogen peroxide-inducible genes activator [Alphaproteobacteria bacterium]|jgi:LysR family hydrogen peroxide-inducible transcriptional activator|nr:hydrogen peroxide-inducible genes activator [Alphaproteobacteria bacterium]MDP7221759.1 hydrogen peroxide-inducible genes activator [Alphaproteobacteria bacterium]
MNHLPTLKQLQYLIALADQRSFSRAAESCYVTQSTLSASIAALEELIGGPVVDRSRKDLSITPLGRQVLDKAKHIVMETNDLLSLARSMDQPLTTTLRMGVIPTVAPYLIPLIIPQIKKHYPQLDLKIFEDQSARILHKLNQGQLDVVLLAFPYDTEGLEEKTLFKDPFIFAAPKAMEKDIPETVSTKDLSRFELLLLEEGHCLREHALEVCDIQSAKKTQGFGATSLVTLIELVRYGFGCTLLPALCLHKSAKIPNVILRPMKKPAPAREIGLAWRKKNPRSEEFILLADLIKKAYEDSLS